jgi:hypothetical protein
LEHAAGADRGELLIITDQPDTRPRPRVLGNLPRELPHIDRLPTMLRRKNSRVTRARSAAAIEASAGHLMAVFG